VLHLLYELTPEQKKQATEILKVRDCNCGCKMNVMQCLTSDPTCDTSKGIARSLIDELFADKKEK